MSRQDAQVSLERRISLPQTQGFLSDCADYDRPQIKSDLRDALHAGPFTRIWHIITINFTPSGSCADRAQHV
jgi:hypothetical protein